MFQGSYPLFFQKSSRLSLVSDTLISDTECSIHGNLRVLPTSHTDVKSEDFKWPWSSDNFLVMLNCKVRCQCQVRGAFFVQ